MASVIAEGEQRAGSRSAGRFQPNHPWDRNFFLLYTGLIWLGVLMGFGTDVIRHFRVHEAPYPLIVHAHAVAMVAWLGLFTTQVLLIRSGRWDIHRRLGLAMTALVAIIVAVSPPTAYIVDARAMGTPDADPSFLCVQWGGVLGFGTLAAAALVFRRQPSVHKRLILLSTVFITDAGYARWLGEAIGKVSGGGFWGFYAPTYAISGALILGIGVYDLITRRRLHPAYIAGLVWTFGIQLVSTTLYLSPAWKTFTTRLLGGH
jgi:hypothetical protein